MQAHQNHTDATDLCQIQSAQKSNDQKIPNNLQLLLKNMNNSQLKVKMPEKKCSSSENQFSAKTSEHVSVANSKLNSNSPPQESKMLAPSHINALQSVIRSQLLVKQLSSCARKPSNQPNSCSKTNIKKLLSLLKPKGVQDGEIIQPNSAASFTNRQFDISRMAVPKNSQCNGSLLIKNSILQTFMQPSNSSMKKSNSLKQTPESSEKKDIIQLFTRDGQDNTASLRLAGQMQSAFKAIQTPVKVPGQTENIISPVSQVSKVSQNRASNLKLQQLNLSKLQLLLKDYSCSSVGISPDIKQAKAAQIAVKSIQIQNAEDVSITENMKKSPTRLRSCKYDKELNKENINSQNLIGKRKRKTERELKILRTELKKNLMWTRDSIKVMRDQFRADFHMSEQQIYKWWWDQTRKRTNKRGIKGSLKDLEAQGITDEDGMLISFQDEFGGYSSRLRLQGEADPEEDTAGNNLEQNLCEMLGINVEAIAYRIAMEEFGEAPSSDTLLRKNSTAFSTTEDMKTPTNDIMGSNTPNVEQADIRSQESDHDRNLELNSIRLCQLMESNSDYNPSSKKSPKGRKYSILSSKNDLIGNSMTKEGRCSTQASQHCI